jgi:hypothetical protein
MPVPLTSRRGGSGGGQPSGATRSHAIVVAAGNETVNSNHRLAYERGRESGGSLTMPGAAD